MRVINADAGWFRVGRGPLQAKTRQANAHFPKLLYHSEQQPIWTPLVDMLRQIWRVVSEERDWPTALIGERRALFRKSE